LEEICCADAKLLADENGNVKMESGVEFQYDGRLFSETGKINTSPAD